MMSFHCYASEKEPLEGHSSPLPSTRGSEIIKDRNSPLTDNTLTDQNDSKKTKKVKIESMNKKASPRQNGSSISAFNSPRSNTTPITQSLPDQSFTQRQELTRDNDDDSPQTSSRKGSDIIVSINDDDDENSFIESLGRFDERCHVFGRCCCGISSGPVKFINMVAMNSKSFITGIAVLGGFDPKVKTALGVTAAILNGVGLASAKIYDYTTNQTIALQKELARLERKRNTTATLIYKEKEAVTKLRMKEFRLLKQNHHAFKLNGDDDSDSEILVSSTKVIKTIERHNIEIDKYEQEELKIIKKQQRLTDLTRTETNYYALSSCFLRYTIGTYIALELFSGIIEIILTPLATIPSWQNDTATASALNTSAIVFTALTTFFTYMKIESQLSAKERGSNFMNRIIAAAKEDNDNDNEI